MAVVAVLLCSTHIRVAEAVKTKSAIEYCENLSTNVFRITGQDLNTFLKKSGIERTRLLEETARKLNEIVLLIERTKIAQKLLNVDGLYHSLSAALTELFKYYPSVKGESKIFATTSEAIKLKQKSNREVVEWCSGYVSALNLFVMAFLSSQDHEKQKVALVVIANVPFKMSDAKRLKDLVSSLVFNNNTTLKQLKENALSNLSLFNFSLQFLTKRQIIRKLYKSMLESQQMIVSKMNGGRNHDLNMAFNNAHNAQSLLEIVFCSLYCVDVIGPKRIQSDFNNNFVKKKNP